MQYINTAEQVMKCTSEPTMIKLTLLSVLVAACAASPIERVVNGTDAKEGEIPYIVSLRFFNSHMCGASILDATHVLTAAHCVDGSESNPSAFSIQYGLLRITNDDTNLIGVSKIVSHPEFSYETTFNDVAVITLESPIKLSDDVRITYLPKQGDPTPGGQTAILAGWGYPYSGGGVMQNLQRVDLKVYTNEDCEAAHHGSANKDYHLCAGIPEGGKGQCSGDSGGPLTVNGVQVGIVSWSVKPCAVKGYPGVYTNVASYVNWIRGLMI